MARNLPRLYLDPTWTQGTALTPGAVLDLSPEHSHYLTGVLRLNPGAELKVFSNHAGEYQATLTEATRKRSKITLHHRLRPPEKRAFLGLAFCPLRSNRLSFLIEKGTELGVSHFYPLQTDHTQQKLGSLERLKAIAIEASEQSDRLGVPTFAAGQKLTQFLEILAGAEATPEANTEANVEAPERQREAVEDDFAMALPRGVTGLVCDERRQAKPLSTALAQSVSKPLIFVGPEGGFSATEFSRFESLQNVVFVGLGPRILRSETAALAALAHFQ